MTKKRKSDASRLDEVDRGIYSSFSSAANHLSQLYTHAMHHQRLSFQAGERHSMEKIYEWILRQQGDGARLTTGDIISYLQNELEYVAEESPTSLITPFQQLQTAIQPTNTSPVRQAPQDYHLAQGGGLHSNNADNLVASGFGSRNSEDLCSQRGEPNPPSSDDTVMDMHSDGHWR